MYVCVCVHACTCMSRYKSIYVHVWTCMSMCISMYVRTCTRMSMCISMYVHVCTCMSMCMSMYVHVCTCMSDIGNHPWSLIYLIHWGWMAQSNPELLGRVSIDSQLVPGISLCCLRPGLQVGCHTTRHLWHLQFWGWWLWYLAGTLISKPPLQTAFTLTLWDNVALTGLKLTVCNKQAQDPQPLPPQCWD